MHLVGFTIEIYYDARPYERQTDWVYEADTRNAPTSYRTGSDSRSWIAKEKFPPHIPRDITTRNWTHVTPVTALYHESQQTK